MHCLTLAPGALKCVAHMQKSIVVDVVDVGTLVRVGLRVSLWWVCVTYAKDHTHTNTQQKTRNGAVAHATTTPFASIASIANVARNAAIRYHDDVERTWTHVLELIHWYPIEVFI